MKCTPWTATTKSIIAYETSVYNAYTAFKITLTYYFESDATVEFKYRKDSKNGYVVNGEFKFIVNNEKVFVDSDYMVNDWQTYKYQTKKGPGKYTFSWIYTKF